jgi:WS/DGAT/MGAT family acyltransferase
MWFVEGLAGGRAALVAKVHHAAIDGLAGVDILATLLDVAPDAPLARDATPIPPADPVPHDVELLARGALALARQPVAFVRNVGRLGGVGVRLLKRALGDPLRLATPMQTPHLTMNGPITPRRRIAFAHVELAAVKAVKDAFGVTVNDVVLALTAGALRRYLAQRDELPEQPLVAAIPVAVPHEPGAHAVGNRVSAMFGLLDVQLPDPVARLRAIRESTSNAKWVQHEFGGEALGDWAELAAPVWFSRVVRLYTSLRIAERIRPFINLVVSNVPGPAFPLYLAGARLESVTPLGPIFDGCGLNVTVISYLDQVHVGFLACRELVPDVDALAAAVRDALTELETAATTAEASQSA